MEGFEEKKYGLRQSGTRLARAGLWHALTRALPSFVAEVRGVRRVECRARPHPCDEIAWTGYLLFDLLFVSGAGFEPDGRADEAEVFADLVGEEALEGEVEFDVLIGEQDEGGWGDGGLGHVVDLDAAVHGDGRALEVDLGEEAVHLAGGDALAALAGDEFDLLEEAFDALAGGGGEEDERGVVEVLEVIADLLLVDVLVGLGGGRRSRSPSVARG